MRHKIFLLVFFLEAALLFPISAFALDLIAPSSEQSNVKTDASFQWNAVPGATKYVLDVNKFTQSEDNVLPGVCSAGVCSFGFLVLKAGTIGYADKYRWRVTALNSAENPISFSPEWAFTTEQAPPPTGPPPGGGGDGGGGGGNFGDLNPIPGTKTLAELFDKIFGFLFGLAIFIVPVVVIYAAFLMLMGGGDPVKLQKGRMILLWTAVAFIVILISRGLPVVLRNLL